MTSCPGDPTQTCGGESAVDVFAMKGGRRGGKNRLLESEDEEEDYEYNGYEDENGDA